MTFAQILKEAGPFVAPLCAGMGLAIRWLLVERKELIEDLKASQGRERDVNAKRTQELLTSASAMGESALVVEKALSEHDRNIQRAVETWASSKK